MTGEAGSNSQDRRKHVRYEHEGNLWVERSADGALVLYTTVNISQSGVLFGVEREMPVGEQLIIHLEMPHFLDLVEARATVRHCTELGEGAFHLGVSIDEVSGVGDQQFRTYIRALFEDDMS